MRLFLFTSTVLVSIFVLQQVKEAGTGQSRHVQRAGDLGEDLWTDNCYIKDIRTTAKDLNITNCWLCMHLPGRAEKGVILHGVPLTKQMMAFGGGYKQESGRNMTGRVFLQLRETAHVCFKRNTTGGVFLGDWERCNKTFIMPTTCFNTSKIKSYDCTNDLQPFYTYYCEMCMYFEDMISWTRISNATWAMDDSKWLLCGKHAYREVPKLWSGTCTMGFVLPVIYKLDNLPNTRIRNKRELDSGVNPGSWWGGMGRALIAPLGIGLNYQDIKQLNNFTIAMFNDTIKSIKMINEELSEVRQVTLQNRYALDIVLAAKGGVCALIHSHCCTYIHNYEPNITKTVHEMETRINEYQKQWDGDSGSLWDMLWSWLPDGSWWKSIVTTLTIIVVILVSLCCCIQCIPNLINMCIQSLGEIRFTNKKKELILYSQSEEMLMQVSKDLCAFETKCNQKRRDCDK